MTSSDPPSGRGPERADGSPDGMVPAPDPDAPDPDAPEPDESGAAVLIPAPPPARLGTGTFTIEGRSAPALFVVGWLATLVGLGLHRGRDHEQRPRPRPDPARRRPHPAVDRADRRRRLAGRSSGASAAACRTSARRRSSSSFASVPVSLLAVLVVSVPLAFVGVPLDGPFGALVSVTVQAAVYVGLVRLLVVDTGALDWAAMGVRRPDRRAVAEGLGGAAWALPIVFVTGIVVVDPAPGRPGRAGQPAAPDRRRPSASPCRSWPGSSSRRSARRSSSGHSPRRPGSAVSGVTRGVVLGALVFAFAHVLTISGSSAGEAFSQAFVGVRRPGADRPRPRLAVRPAQDGLGVVRAPRRVQRDPPGHRRDRLAVVVASVRPAPDRHRGASVSRRAPRMSRR